MDVSDEMATDDPCKQTAADPRNETRYGVEEDLVNSLSVLFLDHKRIGTRTHCDIDILQDEGLRVSDWIVGADVGPDRYVVRAVVKLSGNQFRCHD